MDEKELKHPAFGQLQIFRSTSSHRVALYGTSNQCKETIRISIHNSSVVRNLHNDWYHADVNPIVEIELSPSQFAEAITSLNNGSGIPCTIRKIKDQPKIPNPEFVDKRDEYDQEFEDSVHNIMKKTNDMITTATTMLDQKTVKKSELTAIIKNLHSIQQDIMSNLPFVSKCFHEQLDKSLSSAKMELDAFIDHRLIDAGKLSLKSEAPGPSLLK